MLLRILLYIISCLVVAPGLHAQFLSQRQADSLSTQLPLVHGAAKMRLLNELAGFYATVAPDSGIILSRQAMGMAKRLRDKTGEIRAWSNMGTAYQTLSDYDHSARCFFTAIKMAEKSGDSKILGTLYNGLGINFYYLADLDKSVLYLQKSAEIKLKTGEKGSYATIMANLGGVYHAQGKHAEAMRTLRNAEKPLQDVKWFEALSSLYNSMGSIQQVGLLQLDSAYYYYERALDLALLHDLSLQTATAYHNLGTVLQEKGKYNEALQQYKRALGFSRKAKRNILTLGAYTSISAVYDSLRDYRNAYRYKTMQLALRDSIFKEDKQRSVDQLETQYRSAKKDEQILRQQKMLETDKLNAARQKNRYYVLLFTAVLLLLIAVFIAWYFWQRKNAERKLEKVKSGIYQNIVHEIRTPLTLIKGPLQHIRSKTEDTSLQEDFDLVDKNADRLVLLVNELLDAAKLENKQYKIAFQYGNPQLFVEEICASFKGEAAKRKMQLMYKRDGSSSSVEFPANVLEKAVTNLVSNALKYAEGGNEIFVECVLRDREIILKVKDNGPGIPKKEQARIFDRFYRVEKHRNISGTGIGLSMVKELVELAAGRIELNSRENTGTEITIWLPVREAEQTRYDELHDDSLPHILLVEDEPDVAAFTKRILQDTFAVTLAADGKKGLDLAIARVPDIILTDVMMPVMDGMELLKSVRSHEITQHIPVIIFSAKGSLESRLHGLESGADAYVPKPFNPDELRLQVQNIWNTILRNRGEFEKGLQQDVPFDQRLKGTNSYLSKIIDQVIAHMENPDYSVNELADDMCVSRSQLHRNIKSLTGQSTTQFIKTIRIEKAKDLLRAHDGNITEVAYACGFSSQSYFTRTFTEYVGVSPSDFKK